MTTLWSEIFYAFATVLFCTALACIVVAIILFVRKRKEARKSKEALDYYHMRLENLKPEEFQKLFFSGKPMLPAEDITMGKLRNDILKDDPQNTP